MKICKDCGMIIEEEKMEICICGHPQKNHIGKCGNCMTPDIEYWNKYHIIKDPCECEVYREKK